MSFSNQSNGQYFEDINASFQPQLFVSNLPIGITQNAIADVFQYTGFGNVEQVNIKPGKNGLFAIIKFKQWDLHNTIQARCILKSGKPIPVPSTNWKAFEFKQKLFDKNKKKSSVQYQKPSNSYNYPTTNYPTTPQIINIAPTLDPHILLLHPPYPHLHPPYSHPPLFFEIYTEPFHLQF